LSLHPLRLLPYQEISLWDDFIDAHPTGSIFHTTGMIRSFQATKRHAVFAYGAVDVNQRMVAALVATQVNTLGGIMAWLASRSIMHAAPIYEDTPEGRQAVRDLIQLHDSKMQKRVIFTEIRPIDAPTGAYDPLIESGYKYFGYSNYELNITASESDLMKGLNGKCRNNIRSTQRRGVTVETCDALLHLPICYELFKHSYARSKVPIVDQSLFEAAAVQLSPHHYRMLIARYEGKPIAAGCFLAYKNRVTCWYAGTKRIPGVAATSALFWEAICMYAREGYEIFDFAGAGWEGENYGPGRFKAKFGGELTRNGRYRKIYSSWKFRAAKGVYESVRGWISPRNASHSQALAAEGENR